VASLETWLEAAGITEGAVLSACGFFMRAVAMAFAGDRRHAILDARAPTRSNHDRERNR
jgi:hypothetical protein